MINRRNFLLNASLLATATLATGSIAYRYFRKPSVLRAAVDASASPQLRHAFVEYLKELKNSFAIDGFTIDVADFSSGTGDLRNKFDLVASSISYLPWMPSAAHLFGTLPFGLPRDKKIQWLQSAAGLAAQDKVFAEVGIKGLPLLVGPDSYGFFSSLDLNEVSSLVGKKIAVSDSRSHLWRKLGLVSEGHDVRSAMAALKAGRLHLTDVLSHGQTVQLFSKSEPINAIYYVNGEIKTAYSAHVFFDLDFWRRLSSKQQADFSGVLGKVFERATHSAAEKEALDLTLLASRFDVRALPEPIVSALRGAAPQLRRLMRRELASKLEILEDYESFERAGLSPRGSKNVGLT